MGIFLCRILKHSQVTGLCTDGYRRFAIKPSTALAYVRVHQQNPINAYLLSTKFELRLFAGASSSIANRITTMKPGPPQIVTE